MSANYLQLQSYKEQGNMAPLAVISMLLLFVVLAFSVDQGIACTAKIQQENALDAARNACMDASFAFAAKNKEVTGAVVATHVMEALRAEGFGGSVDVWFFDAPAEHVPKSRRLWGIAIQVQEDSPTVFARGYGIATLPVASNRILIAEPYADTVAWRPIDNGNGCYQLQAGDKPTAYTNTHMNELGDYPTEFVEAVQSGIAQSKNGAIGKEK